MSGDSQITTSPFELVIFSNPENERYYDQAFDAAKGQRLPFVCIHRARNAEHVAVVWRKLLKNIKSEWVFRINADVALRPNATTKLMAHLTAPGVGAFRCGVENYLLGNRFVDEVGTPDAIVFRTEALRKAVDEFISVPAFDMTALTKLAKFTTANLYSRTRDIKQGTPGAVGEDKVALIMVGTNISDWQPDYVFRWCYRLGAHLRGVGATDIGTLVESMAGKKHPHWQLGVTAFIQGFASGDGPGIAGQPGTLEARFQHVEILADRGVPQTQQKVRLL